VLLGDLGQVDRVRRRDSSVVASYSRSVATRCTDSMPPSAMTIAPTSFTPS